jgi:hypothetical protein
MIDLQWKFLKNLCELFTEIEQRGFIATGGELYRTIEQQKIYFDSGKSKTMDSNHLKRLAIDLNIFKDGVLIYDKDILQPLGDYWEGLDENNRWGGNFKGFLDTPHFEYNINH